MRRVPNALRRPAYVCAVMIISGSCTGDKVPWQVGDSGDEPEPAELVTLTGDPAKRLAAYNPPPDSPVLMGSGDKSWFAVVFTEKPADMPSLLDKVLIRDDVPGCVRDGPVACCDATKGVFLFNTKSGWIRMGERCKLLPVVPDTPNGGPYFDIDPVPPDLSRALLACCGITSPYVTMAKEDGKPRVLDLGTTLPQKAERWRPPRTMQSFGLPAGSPILLAHGHPIPNPPNCVGNVANPCAKTTARKCHPGLRHWFYKMLVGGDTVWCQMEKCSC
jgi:hypothetical protein